MSCEPEIDPSQFIAELYSAAAREYAPVWADSTADERTGAAWITKRPGVYRAIIGTMRPIYQSRTRRIMSALLLLCFAFYGIEAEVADIHDRDAEAAELPTGADPVQDTHAFHVCHCSHTHMGVLPLIPQLTSIVVQSGQQPMALDPSLSSYRLAAPLRPPIA